MAFNSFDLQGKFGTETELTTSPATVATGAFSIASDTSSWVNTDDAPEAMFKFKITAASLAAAPAAGDTIDLFMVHENVEGTEDTPTPTDNYPHTYMGSFTLWDSDSDQVHVIGPVTLPNYVTSQSYVPYIRNNMSQATGTGWQLWIKTVSVGPR